MTERSIVLLRHSKAEQPDGIADIERPLTDRGHADAGAAGAWLTGSDNLPDLVLCSPAKRTRQTWHAVAVAIAGTAGESGPGAGAPEVRYEQALYAGSAGDLLAVLRDAGDAYEAVLVVGHNPSISDLSALLDPASGGDEGLRTSGIAVHRFTGSWGDLAADSAEVTDSHTARG
ncbi:SixA phosphatase family protein [Polymorphospora rubra]|uniref:SixA phosphatase family protein n=1 Tax=Polymorphospora rubra TaxID=338584 RepID=UPI0033DE2B1E